MYRIIYFQGLNKKKIINDPVYGFINIPSEIVFDLISHPYFQRLRYIKQLGMTHLVYPGALHTRFHHAIGAMHLMSLAIEVLRGKGQDITAEEEEAATIAILLHDIGHGPFSHALEHTLVNEIKHEDISMRLMEKLNEAFDGRLTLAIRIFKGDYPKHFLPQLVSSQLDLDRMDYLNRDSFFTGVSEGVISFDRIIKMFNVLDEELVIEEKGIYSIEKFLIARRLMYWQVYLHKTVIAGEMLLVKILERAKYLASHGEALFATPALQHFLKNEITEKEFFKGDLHLEQFSKLDDQDIFASVKVWAEHPDRILSQLCGMLNQRNLYKVEISNDAPDESRVAELRARTAAFLNLNQKDVCYFVFTDMIRNRAYNAGSGNINILLKNNTIIDIAKASDLSNLESLDKTVKKHILCYPRII
ncbi:metal-dependent phosphohydrolase HD sub domain protein [Pedobacter heparinus DSM 2366]|uniref:Metal-dependent phosphohydrolase HD sub domain protein n=1 Tax=Pedobacter heparinus (strain ATCC 13125 / DSM 2366 / CIP 104194 / JCM 7457 / NBRC 12017 / NCIMB 9290 / NRRL B-14731 / HIM 762-3) TaxID=485917 RepID=C6XXG6_PEDHD|nr:metal-dependent phosphohydrolase HD sub domain protein [Pedobacter heparinus DSM 2366]